MTRQSNLSGYSNTATTTTLNPDTQAPTAPSGFGGDRDQRHADQLELDGIDGQCCGHAVSDRELLGGGCSNFVQVGTATGTTFNNTGLTQNTSYSYRVRAGDAASNLSSYSNTASAATSDGQVPTAPSGLAATAISGTQINLSWTASTDNVGVTQYLVESCSGVGCSNFAQIGTTAGTTFNNTGLTQSASYSYRVRRVTRHRI